MIEAHWRIGEELLQETQECLAFVQKNGGVGELRWVHLVPVQFIISSGDFNKINLMVKPG